MSLIFEPGYYTKIRVDDEGKIVDVGDLEPEDLPQHTHSVDDIDGESLKQKIADILATFFANNGSTTVKFVYDKKTKTISADVDIDEETIYKNEFGQLASAGGGEGGGGSGSDVDFSEEIEEHLKDFNKTLPDKIKQAIATMFANNPQSAVIFDWDKSTNTFSADVRYDGISLIKDENGDLIATGATPGEGGGGNCASHTHVAAQIEDFEEAVKALFDGYSKNINIDIRKYVDGNTIKVNEYGQLVSVRSALEKHTHLLKDIIDYKAPDPAATQPMTDLGEDVILNDGLIDFSKLNIGYSILAIDRYIANVVNPTITQLNRKIDIVSSSVDNPGLAVLSLYKSVIRNNLYDRDSKFIREVCYAPSVYLTLDYIPYSEGIIKLVINGIVVASANIEKLAYENDIANVFKVERVYIKNSYVARVLKIDAHDFLKRENVYDIQVKFERGSYHDFTNIVTIASTPYQEIPISFQDVSETHEILGKKYYNYPKQLKYALSLENYLDHRFINTSAGFVNGVLTGISAKTFDTISIPNLFVNTNVTLNFELEEEHTDCLLAKYVDQLQSGGIVNNKLVSLDAKGCKAVFALPGSERFNTLKLIGNLPEEFISITKGSLKAKATTIADLNTGTYGKIPLAQGKDLLLSFLDAYNDGSYKMKLVIETKNDEAIDLSNIYFELLTL